MVTRQPCWPQTKFVYDNGKFAEFFWSVLAAGYMGAQARLHGNGRIILWIASARITPCSKGGCDLSFRECIALWRTCRKPESDHAKLLSSKANVSWHAAIFKMLPSVSKQSFKTIAGIAAIHAVVGPVSRVDTVSLHTRFVFGKFAEFFWSVLAAGCMGAQARLR